MRRSSHASLALAAAAFVLGVAAHALIAPELAGRRVLAETTHTAASGTRISVRTGHPAEVMRVVDGDTFEARVHVWPGIDITTKVRLRNIDAPEMRARCPEERTKAEAAREALRAMLAEGDVIVRRIGVDKYGGRVLADAGTRTTPDVGAAMLQRGLARPYSGGRREPWCDGT